MALQLDRLQSSVTALEDAVTRNTAAIAALKAAAENPADQAAIDDVANRVDAAVATLNGP